MNPRQNQPQRNDPRGPRDGTGARDDRRPRDGRDDRGGRGPQDNRGGGGRPALPGGRGGPGPRFESRAPIPRENPPAPVPTVSASVAKAGVPHGTVGGGWLPDLIYTGEKFESGLALFADATGRITRFSREPADLAAARRLEGQAVLPGLINAHSHAWHRALRGRTDALERALAGLGDEEVFDAARLVFLEMLLGGVTCVGEFHFLRGRPDGTPWPEAHHLAAEIIRAAHEVGLRIALLNVAGDDTAPARFRTAGAEAWVRETEALRLAVEKNFPADEAWVGAGVQTLGALPPEQLKTIAAYARTQRMRLHAQVPPAASGAGRTPLAALAELGFLDKRFTAVDAAGLSDDDVKLLGTARALVCACPGSALAAGFGVAPVEKILAAGAGLALGTDTHARTEVLGEARLLELHLRGATGRRAAVGNDAPTTLFHAATVAGARSLGATGGALEVGRPADFFTVSLHDPSLVGADAATLLHHVVFGLERRAIRDVWVGGRQRIAAGRHLLHGAIVGRFSDGLKKLWA